MRATDEKECYIHIQLPGRLDKVPCGHLSVRRTEQGFVGHFSYGRRYIERSDAVSLDPVHLPLSSRVFEFTDYQGVPGALLDAGPNAWGRRVIENKLGVKPGDLWEIDYLLEGPEDGAGALTFSRALDSAGPRRGYNRTTHLERLIQAAQVVEDNAPLPQEYLEQIEPATSLGGARPKATVEDDGALWLAKFPQKGDPFSIQRVEFATLQLAKAAGLQVNESRLVKVGEQDVLMLKRFDRLRVERDGRAGYLRHQFMSANTILDCPDSAMDRTRWSYPLLADEISRTSSKPVEDCHELFRRMVFNCLVTNDDDHPRNHGLIGVERGWRLSPAYDIVPTPKASHERNLAMTIGDRGRQATISNLLSNCARFRLSEEQALNEIRRIVPVIRDWRKIFFESGVSPKDIEYIAQAFLPESFFDVELDLDAVPESPGLSAVIKRARKSGGIAKKQKTNHHPQ